MDSPVVAALTAFHPVSTPGDEIVVYDGPMSVGGRSTSGQVCVRFRPRLDIVWRTRSRVSSMDLGDMDMVIPHELATVTTTAQCSGQADGSLRPVQIGSQTSNLARLVVLWVNLPSLRAPDLIEDSTSTFMGRWQENLAGWTVTLDRRSDHSNIWAFVQDEGATAVTHVMEIRRADGVSFAPQDVEPVLEALHLGMSFAVGRWVAPIVPVGFDASGRRVWEEWAARVCTTGAPGVLRWWPKQHDWLLREFLGLVVARFADPDRQFSTRFLLASAIQSAGGGYVEQRIMMATAGLEHLAWVALHVDGSMSKTKFNQIESAAEKLRLLAQQADVGEPIDADVIPALAGFAATRPVGEQDGPSVLFGIRNKIVHPTGHESVLYKNHPGLVTEAWLLACHYLVLLVLHHLGYTGDYQSQLEPGGWEGDTRPVPWSV